MPKMFSSRSVSLPRPEHRRCQRSASMALECPAPITPYSCSRRSSGWSAAAPHPGSTVFTSSGRWCNAHCTRRNDSSQRCSPRQHGGGGNITGIRARATALTTSAALRILPPTTKIPCCGCPPPAGADPQRQRHSCNATGRGCGWGLAEPPPKAVNAMMSAPLLQCRWQSPQCCARRQPYKIALIFGRLLERETICRRFSMNKYLMRRGRDAIGASGSCVVRETSPTILRRQWPPRLGIAPGQFNFDGGRRFK
jgi:hypothetical protein